MTTGAPLYLVSACVSAEEFVAAFRRYADRTGLFVPSATPLPAGRRGRIAITLVDGGVMIEGEAEVLQSSSRPTVLQGRPGMTIKFIEPDELGKTVIAELEKARLAMKPAPSAVTPRPAVIPAAPRPVVPPAGGRIDAANALAECVVIGDVASLADTKHESSQARFMVPAIPAVGAPRPPSTAPDRPKTPSTPPPRAKVPTVPPSPSSLPVPAPRMTSVGFPIVDKLPAKTESGKVSNATTLGLTPLQRAPAENPLFVTHRGTNAPPNPTPPSTPAQNPRLDTNPGHSPPAKFVPNATTLGMPALEKAPNKTVHEVPTRIGAPPSEAIHEAPTATQAMHEAPTAAAPPLEKTTDPDPMPVAVPSKSALAAAVGVDESTTIGSLPPRKPAAPASVPREASGPMRDSGKHKATSIGFPAIRTPFETQPLRVVPPSSPSAFSQDPDPPQLPSRQSRAPAPAPRGKEQSRRPRVATPVAPMPAMRGPAKSAPHVEDEKTDLAQVPLPPVVPETPAAEVSAHGVTPTEPQTAQRSGGMRASEILAAIPASGDWTMAPDENTPHILSKQPDPPVIGEPPPKPEPAKKGPPTGDWTISLDPDTGWSEPAKPPQVAAPPASGNPVGAVASDKPIQAQRWDDKPTGLGEAKIEIDPTLMEPHKVMPVIEDDPIAEPPPPLTPLPPIAGYTPTPPPWGTPAAMPAPMPMYPPQIGTGPFPRDEAPRGRTLIIAIAAGVLILSAIIAVVVIVMGKKVRPAPESAETASSVSMAAGTKVGSAGSAGSVGSVGSAGSAAVVAPKPPPPVEAPKPAKAKCVVEVSSTPKGADVLADKTKLGITPGKFELPCDVEAKLTIRKKPFNAATRTMTPVADKPNKLVVKLTKNIVSVKVTSSPPGATITAGGKSLGVTPTTIKLPAGEPTTLTLTKPGFASATSKLTPKPSGTSSHVTLKKKR